MKNLFVSKALYYSFIFLATVIPTLADVKIKSKQTISGETYENAVYIKGKRERTESMGGKTVEIMQCDLKRTIEIVPQAQGYTITPFNDPNATTDEKIIDQKTTTAVTKGSTITTTITTKDTGERKQMFGYTARHIVTTIEMVSSPDACDPVNMKMQQDGWYIDAAFVLSCQQDSYKNYAPQSSESGCRNKSQIKQIGTAKTGFALLEKMTMFDESGKESFSTTNEVVELSNATLNDSLFDVPAGYKEFKDSSQMYESMTAKTGGNSSNQSGRTTGGGNLGMTADSSGLGSTIKNMSDKNSDAPSAVGEKKPGVTRIGLANVKTGSVGEGVNAQELGAAVASTLAEYLRTPRVEVVRLEAKLPSQAALEAREKSCDFVFYATVSHKKGGGGFGSMFSKTANGMIGTVIPLGSGASAEIAGNAATTAVNTAAATSSHFKSKDEITIEYKLVTTTDAPALAKTLKAKTKSDGENILSPLIEQIAQAIVDAVTKNQS